MSQGELFQVGQRTPLPPPAGRFAGNSRSRPTPATIGTGPAGETCRTCRHYTRLQHHDRVHLKCGLMQAYWTHGPGSDIKAGWPACSQFERKDGE